MKKVKIFSLTQQANNFFKLPTKVPLLLPFSLAFSPINSFFFLGKQYRPNKFYRQKVLCPYGVGGWKYCSWQNYCWPESIMHFIGSTRILLAVDKQMRAFPHPCLQRYCSNRLSSKGEESSLLMFVHYIPRKMQVYLRDGSAQTIVYTAANQAFSLTKFQYTDTGAARSNPDPSVPCTW